MKKLNRTSKFHLYDGTAQVTVDENELNELEAALAEAVELLRGVEQVFFKAEASIALVGTIRQREIGQEMESQRFLHRAFLDKHGGEEQ